MTTLPPPPIFQALTPSAMLSGTVDSSAAAAAAMAAAANNDTKQHHRSKLRVAIVTENFLPKVDGVTRTLARLLEHFNTEGHEAIVLGPDTGLTSYAGHAVVGTFGLPLIIYPGLKLNFMRPRFIRRLQQFKPDVIHFVDPIFLGAQVLPAVQKWMPEVPCVASYHTNLPTYATLFGMPFLENTMWKLTRSLHDRCEMTFCPSESTRRMLQGKGFRNVEIWSRGVDVTLFNPQARDENLRASWGCTPKPASLQVPLTPSVLPQLMTTTDIASYDRAPPSRKESSSSSSASSSNGDDSFIRTPPSGAFSPNKRGSTASLWPASPELSPPPSYDSLSGIPELPGGMAFALPPPAVGAENDKAAFLQNVIQRKIASANSSGGATPLMLPAEEESRTVILYVGRISWEKNLRLLIEAFRQLPAPVRQQAKLVFVGDGPARADLTKLCKKYDLDASFMGHQKGKRLAAMYASSSVFAFPSFTETFGQVVLEALASGLPVVGLHAEGTSDLVSHGKSGLLLDINAATASANTAAASASIISSQNSRPATLSRSDSASNFADAANQAAASLIPSSPSSKIVAAHNPQNAANGLPTPIPSVIDFANAMQPSSAGFQQCVKSYSMLLERLILNRPLRAAMGQRAQLYASKKTWWDAMDAVVVGYHEVIRRRGVKNLNDEELEALRSVQVQKAALTGPVIKVIIAIYLVLFTVLLAQLL